MISNYIFYVNYILNYISIIKIYLPYSFKQIVLCVFASSCIWAFNGTYSLLILTYGLCVYIVHPLPILICNIIINISNVHVRHYRGFTSIPF